MGGGENISSSRMFIESETCSRKYLIKLDSSKRMSKFFDFQQREDNYLGQR